MGKAQSGGDSEPGRGESRGEFEHRRGGGIDIAPLAYIHQERDI